MDEPYYHFDLPVTETRYDFISISQEKKVRKRVMFTTLSNRQVCNLALVDVLADGTVSDIIETRNKDMTTVLATVIRIIANFLSDNASKIVLFRGSDERRQRLYRLIISRDLIKIQKEFNIFGGMKKSKAEPFKPNKDYDYFIILKNQ